MRRMSFDYRNEGGSRLHRFLAVSVLLLVIPMWPDAAGAATVTATVLADGGDPETMFTVEMAGESELLPMGGTATDRNASPERYPMALVPVPGFRLTDIACFGDNGGRISAVVAFENQSVIFDPGDGNFVNCLFRLEAQTAIVRATVLTNAEHVETEFVVEMQGEAVELAQGEVATDRNAPSALYRMALLPAPGFQLRDIDCFDVENRELDATVTFENQGISFSPGAGGVVNCTFRLHAQVATVTAIVLTDATRVATEFTIEMHGEPVTLQQGETAIDRSARADLYRMALLPQPGFRLMDIVCRNAANERLPATITFENQSVAFTPGAGSVVSCTFDLEARVATVTATVLTDSADVDNEFVLEMGEETVRMVQGMMAIDRSAPADGYHMTLQPVPGLRLVDIVCLEDDDTEENYDRVTTDHTAENQSIAFSPGIGSVIDCTFRLNVQASTVTATVLTDVGHADQEFTVELEGERHPLLHGQTAADHVAAAQNYRMSLLPAPGFSLTDIICVAADDDHPGERLPANITFENQSVAFAPGAGRFVNCVFRLQAMPDAAVTGTGSAGPASTPPGDCCSCQVASGVALQAPPMLPCTFDFPAGWDARFGNDGALISAVAGAQCGAACRVSPAQSFSVATGPNRNAETMEEIWSSMMTVVGTGSCGDRGVTFFESPGSDPNGQLGGVQFHVGVGDKLYSANATFTCPVPGEWQNLRDLFIGSFRTNPGSTFGQD